MNNIKGYAVANDGSMKRIAITYDEIGDSGKPIKMNVKTSNYILDDKVLEAITIIETYAQNIVDNIE